MTTIKSTVTPLMLAAADGLNNNDGFALNQTLDTAVVAYTEAYQVTPASVGLSPNGTLGSDGVSIYDIWYETDGNGNITATHVDNLGTLANIIPGGWMIDCDLYNGTLSGFGGMVAERIASGYNANTTAYSGRYRTYLGDETLVTLGSNTIPAITQTTPIAVTGISGMMTYYMDHAINNPIGSTTSKDVAVMISTLGQAAGMIQRSNTYLEAIDAALSANLKYYGYDTYQDFITQGWLKYQTGNVLPTAFKNIGTMTDSIFTGKFGTPGAVAYVLLGRQLGNVGNLASMISAERINTSDIMNPMYADQLTRVLSRINEPTDLAIIQNTIESTIPAMTSALDYTDIARCAGATTNDSAFSSFAEVGIDLYNKSPYITIERGGDVANIISNITAPSSTLVEALATSTSVLTTTITNSIKSGLPTPAAGNSRLTVFDVIGSPSGYYSANVVAVNQAIENLDDTGYGPQIRANLQTMLNFTNQANIITNSNVTLSTTSYNILMNAIVANSNTTIANIVTTINTNYTYVSGRVALETINWNSLGIRAQGYGGIANMLSFATSLPAYATDTTDTSGYEYLLGILENNQTGDVIRGVFAEAQNYQIIQNFGVTPNGFVG